MLTHRRMCLVVRLSAICADESILQADRIEATHGGHISDYWEASALHDPTEHRRLQQTTSESIVAHEVRSGVFSKILEVNQDGVPSLALDALSSS